MTAAVFWRALGRSCGGLMLTLILFSGCGDHAALMGLKPEQADTITATTSPAKPPQRPRYQLFIRSLNHVFDMPSLELCILSVALCL